LNRIADAVAMPLDYQVMHLPPRAEPAITLAPWQLGDASRESNGEGHLP
jgi:hypothetical protein